MEDEKNENKQIRLPEDIREKMQKIGHDNIREALDMWENYKGKIKNIKVQSDAADQYVKEMKKKKDTLIKIQGILRSMSELIGSELG
jgi:chromosomal replication initiation ATPase DnaA